MTKRWGVGHYLAIALIERCGGHLSDIHRALRSLSIRKRNAIPLRVELSAYVEDCLNSVEGDAEATDKMTSMLRTLAGTPYITIPYYAYTWVYSSHDSSICLSYLCIYIVIETGFCEVKSATDTIANKICLYNIGGLVAKESTICGFYYTPKSWTTNYGLVPIRQSMRLAIEMVLDSRGSLKK